MAVRGVPSVHGAGPWAEAVSQLRCWSVSCSQCLRHSHEERALTPRSAGSGMQAPELHLLSQSWGRRASLLFPFAAWGWERSRG